MNASLTSEEKVVAKEQAGVTADDRAIIAIDNASAHGEAEGDPSGDLIQGANALDAINRRRKRPDTSNSRGAAFLDVKKSVLAKKVRTRAAVGHDVVKWERSRNDRAFVVQLNPVELARCELAQPGADVEGVCGSCGRLNGRGTRRNR